LWVDSHFVLSAVGAVPLLQHDFFVAGHVECDNNLSSLVPRSVELDIGAACSESAFWA
jgi:hypothetical protein